MFFFFLYKLFQPVYSHISYKKVEIFDFFLHAFTVNSWTKVPENGLSYSPEYVNGPKCDETDLTFLVTGCFQGLPLYFRDPFCDSLVYW